MKSLVEEFYEDREKEIINFITGNSNSKGNPMNRPPNHQCPAAKQGTETLMR